MHCWFCESPLRSSGPGEIYCPFGSCPACKDLAPAWALLDGPESERWRRMKDAGTLRGNLAEAGLIQSAG